MDGYIEVCSKQNEGTEFKIRIKFDRVPIGIAREHLKNKDKKELVGKSLEGLKILICEDMKINARIITKMLDKFGLITEIAENGEEGVKLVKANRYDAVLMDIRMPVMDGLEAARIIKASVHGKQTKIAAISAHVLGTDRNEIFEAGCDDFIAKPFDISKIKKVINIEIMYALKE